MCTSTLLARASVAAKVVVARVGVKGPAVRKAWPAVKECPVVRQMVLIRVIVVGGM